MRHVIWNLEDKPHQEMLHCPEKLETKGKTADPTWRGKNTLGVVVRHARDWGQRDGEREGRTAFILDWMKETPPQ